MKVEGIIYMEKARILRHVNITHITRNAEKNRLFLPLVQFGRTALITFSLSREYSFFGENLVVMTYFEGT